MSDNILKRAAQDIPPLRAVVVTVMPDCLLYDSWTRKSDIGEFEAVASFFGDLVRSNRQALKSLGSWTSEMQVTIEASDSLIVLKELNEHFVCGAIFERSVPLGMVRLYLRRMMDEVLASLPKVHSVERPRAVRIIEFLQRYAPDAHAVLMRLSIRTRIGIEALSSPEGLTEEQTSLLEQSAAQILGLEKINV